MKNLIYRRNLSKKRGRYNLSIFLLHPELLNFADSVLKKIYTRFLSFFSLSIKINRYSLFEKMGFILIPHLPHRRIHISSKRTHAH